MHQVLCHHEWSYKRLWSPTRITPTNCRSSLDTKHYNNVVLILLNIPFREAMPEKKQFLLPYFYRVLPPYFRSRMEEFVIVQKLKIGTEAQKILLPIISFSELLTEKVVTVYPSISEHLRKWLCSRLLTVLLIHKHFLCSLFYFFCPQQ